VERSHRTDQEEFYQLLTYTDDVDLKKKIEKLDNLQLELIEEYIELVGSDLPLEMQCYFTGEKLHTDEIEILYNWAVAYNHGEE
jgi:hypothetical protein